LSQGSTTRRTAACIRALLCATTAAVVACGGAVTDPLGGGFAVDPAPVLGEWAAPPALIPPVDFDALLLRDGNALDGFFEYELWGRWWVVHFEDATWDGETVRFVDHTDFGQREADSLVYWEARYVPARSSTPRQIALTASFGPGRSCCIVSMSYRRPSDLPSAALTPGSR